MFGSGDFGDSRVKVDFVRRVLFGLRGVIFAVIKGYLGSLCEAARRSGEIYLGGGSGIF